MSDRKWETVAIRDPVVDPRRLCLVPFIGRVVRFNAWVGSNRNFELPDGTKKKSVLLKDIELEDLPGTMVDHMWIRVSNNVFHTRELIEQGFRREFKGKVQVYEKKNVVSLRFSQIKIKKISV